MLQKCSTKNVNTKLGIYILGLSFSYFFLSLAGFKLCSQFIFLFPFFFYECCYYFKDQSTVHLAKFFIFYDLLQVFS